MSAPVFNITIEENSDFTLELSVTQLGVDLTLVDETAMFKIAKSYTDKNPIDLSAYVTASDGLVNINVPAEAIKTIPFLKGVYDVVIQIDETHRKRVLQGKVKILKAVSK